MIENKIEKITSSIEPIVYNDAYLYLINEEQLLYLLGLESRVKENSNSNSKNPFMKYGKIINPKVAAIKYNLYTRKTPRIIVDPQKVYEYLDKEFNLFKNVLSKEFDEKLLDSNLTEADAAKYRKELEKRISREEKILEELKNNFSKYEVVISNYNDIRAYPTIYYTGEDKKQNTEHLSVKAPNFLYFKDSKLDRKVNATVKEFIENADLVGNTIFFKKK